MQDCIIQQCAIPQELIGPFTECRSGLDDRTELDRCLVEEGYVFLRGVLNADEVLAAREEVFRGRCRVSRKASEGTFRQRGSRFF